MNTLTSQPNDFRAFLQTELIRRSRANPRYSLRAFAKTLELEPSRLSKMLRGERPIRGEVIEKLGLRLGLPLKDIRGYQGLPTTTPVSEAAPATTPAFRQLPFDAFEVIEDSRHDLLLELMKLKGFKTDLKWLSKKLGSPLPETRAIVERLERMGLLEVQPNGTWKDLSEGFSSWHPGDMLTSVAHRRSQHQVLARAQAALESQPIETRDQSTMMMATSPEKILAAKELIKNFRRELCAFLEDSKDKTAVYQLSVSLFSLTDLKNEGEME